MKNDDILEQEIFDFVKEDKGVPIYVDNAIEDAIHRVKSAPKLEHKFRKVAIVVISLGIATTSVVFAKDIANFFKSIFTNSTPGIDSAIQNGYVQDVNMDFIYDNNIGIKIDSVVKDNNILDIAFVFDCLNKEKDITNIVIDNFEIVDENDKVIKIYSGDGIRYINNDNQSIIKIEMENNVSFVNGLYYKSILLRIKNNLNFENLRLKIHEIKIYENDNFKIINGNWKFNLSLNENLTNININEYNMKYDSNVLKVFNEIHDTSFIVNINFLENLDFIIISNIGNVVLRDDLGNEYEVSTMDFYEENSNICLKFDFGKYNLPENLSLYIKYNDNKETLIEFYK